MCEHVSKTEWTNHNFCPQKPPAYITSIDISANSVGQAKKKIGEAGYTNVSFQQGDIFNLAFEPESFNHFFVCFVLEHFAQPLEALKSLRDFLKVNGTITVIEGDHGSTCLFPDNTNAHRVIRCQVELQRRAGGNVNIGRQLYPLICDASFSSFHVSTPMVYVDSIKPQLIEGFMKNTFTAMIEGIRKPSIEARIIDKSTFDEGIKGLYRTIEKDGVFCYTFFKATATKKMLMRAWWRNLGKAFCLPPSY